ncbi:hypothetical protein BKA62DRAFT_233886 [Auriculariales sp. MPI-PUGE-AT-0066]|nr:hypothetical protein BKA62DRAFT_233886 [Auriculariales sp. MPI-PUGE-AT-0066]
MFWKLATITCASALLVTAQKDGPAAKLNANPTDTSNPRLNGKLFPYDQIPYQADTSPPTTNPIYRGPQAGYNVCNDTTAGPGSMCQTVIVNSIEDFCLFAPNKLSDVGSAEHDVVAWCTKPTHGARLIPEGTLTGVQFLRAPSYVAVIGFIKQENINVKKGDGGGELDSGGQDLRGNPVGGLAYSENLPSTPGTMTQSRIWHEFIGSNMFCMKYCDDKAPNASGICRHTLDTIGCFANVRATYRDNVFLSCDSEDQGPVEVGVTDAPQSSQCTTFTSSVIYAVSTSTTATATPTDTPGGSQSGGSSTTSGGSNPSQTPGGGASMRAQAPFVALAVVALFFGAVFA